MVFQYLRFNGKDMYARFRRAEGTVIAKVDLHDKKTGQAIHGTYNELLFRPEWREKRLSILKRDHEACVVCTSTDKLQVHHRQYLFEVTKQQFRAPWDYPDYLMITLCERCHKRGHSKFKVPTLYI
jgi:hypothetical protein